MEVEDEKSQKGLRGFCGHYNNKNIQSFDN